MTVALRRKWIRISHYYIGTASCSKLNYFNIKKIWKKFFWWSLIHITLVITIWFMLTYATICVFSGEKVFLEFSNLTWSFIRSNYSSTIIVMVFFFSKFASFQSVNVPEICATSGFFFLKCRLDFVRNLSTIAFNDHLFPFETLLVECWPALYPI